MTIIVLGVDLAKNVFQLCALNQAGKVKFNRKMRRARLRASVGQLEPTVIAMEACASAYYWGRTFEAMGHSASLRTPILRKSQLAWIARKSLQQAPRRFFRIRG